ncbi:VWA domain-containing protein [Poritiphilus flavus]|uniref:VWA domain-containing protein n=1 Tax=Poritiphilus flavus TaxID=2697053 RepID=A0A6L9EH16_9FLAO|nr:vWA domain-containing protein [Poritiphilus flavus]NAS13808.1 VWA domain-containing protein [Poritiphilus flavus]
MNKKLKQTRIQLSLGFFLAVAGLGYSCEGVQPKKTENCIIAQAAQPEAHIKKPTVKIALLLDTSNSMDGLINQAKSQLWDIVNQFTYAKCGNSVRPDLQIALYQYGNDGLSSREGYIQQVIGFSNDLDELSEKLFSLTTNGGEEFCGQVIQTSLRQLDWGKNPDDLKMIFIAGNEPFTQGKLNYKDAVTNAMEKDVVVNTIFCGAYEQGIHTEWKRGALMSGGEYMAINHNRRQIHIATPYDDIIIELNTKLNKTYISYGASGKAKMRLQSEQDQNAMALEEAVAVKRAVSKSSRMYKNKSWDLVDAAESEDFQWSEVEKEHLPESLKGKSDAALEAYVKKQRQERKRIQEEIKKANIKREAYIAKHQKDSRGELENAMLSALKQQAAKKNYRWD